MLQVPVDGLEIAPGHAYQWRLAASGAGTPGGVASYDQAARFATAEGARVAGEPRTFYVAVTFDLPGSLDLDALEAALLHVIRRHDVLRTRYWSSGAGLRCDVLGPADAGLTRVQVGQLVSAAETRSYLHAAFREVDTLGGPLVTMGAIVRDGSTTVHFSCDHIVSDVVSASIVASDIAAAYGDLSEGREPELPPVGRYADFARDERAANRALAADSEKLDHWRDFAARNAEFFPAFPLDLGVEPGRWYPSVNETDTLLTGPEAERLEARCREAGGTLTHGLLAGMAAAVRDEGGPEVYRTLMPLDRRGGRYRDAAGWFVNAVPVEVAAPRGSSFAELMAQARKAYAPARRCADVHYLRAWELLAPERIARRPVSFLSYVDFRGTPGAALRPSVHVWPAAGRGIALWLHRDDDGLHLNAAYADTARARRTKQSLAGTLAWTLRDFSAVAPGAARSLPATGVRLTGG